MTCARAPGKLVLSGAYAVLEGAPVIVAAVDRYVVADTARVATHRAPEVVAALGEDARLPAFDATALRTPDGSQKLGLGSSAAIVAASLGAVLLAERALDPLARPLSDDELQRAVFPRALDAHRRAQGGGSGVDVLAACFGGLRLATLDAGGFAHRALALPEGVRVTVLAAEQAASTSDLLGRVRALRDAAPAEYATLMRRQRRASEAAAAALESGDGEAFLASLRDQCAALAALGDAAGVALVTPELRGLALAAGPRDAVLPAGAGGGDVALWLQPAATPEDAASLERRAAAARHRVLCCQLGARGLHAA